MSVASLIVAIRTVGAAQLGRLRSGVNGLTNAFRRQRIQVSSVAGAYRDVNGVWRNANGTLIMQRDHLRDVAVGYSRVGRAAQDAGESVSKAFSRNGPLIAAAAAGLAVLAPAIGAAISATLVTAFSGGVVGAAIAVAVKQSDSLQSAFSKTFRRMGGEIKLWATGFDDEILGVVTRFGRAWDKISDNLGKGFQTAQKFVQPFADGIASLVEGMFGGGGFNDMLEKGQPVIQEFSRGLAEIGDAFNSFFDSLSDGGEGEVKGMIALMSFLAGTIRFLGNALEFLSKAFDFVTDKAEMFADTMSAMLGWLPGVGDMWQYISRTIGNFNDTAGKTRDLMPLVATSADSVNAALGAQADRAAAAGRAMRGLSEKMSDLINKNLSVDQAALAWQRSLDALIESVKEHGRQLGITTAAGQANRDAILDSVEAAVRAKDAAIELAGGEKASKEAVQAANAAFQRQIGDLEALMRKLGFTQAQIDALLGKYREIANAPNITKTVTVVTRFREEGGPRYNPGPGQHVAFAKGTPSAPPGWAWVGEEGPELVKFRGGEQVMTAGDSQAAARAGGTPGGGVGGASQLVLSVAGGERGLASLLKAMIRNGDLKLTLINGRVAVA